MIRSGKDVRPRSSMVGRGRIQLFMVFIAVAGVLLGARAAHLSFTDVSGYAAVADEGSMMRVSQQTLVKRGDILSVDGRKLATSLEVADIVATPYQVENPEDTARALHEVIGQQTGKSVSEIEAALRKTNADGKPGGYSVVGSVDPETASKVVDLGLAGIETAPSSKRVYPDGSSASQLVGHLGDYDKPYGGVEARYDGTLKAGDDVHLTVDAAVLQQLENSLSGAMKEFKAKSALGLVMRVDDGSIVALANVPGYNNEKYSDTDAELQRDRVVTDAYEPGSTFKPFTVATALEDGTLSPNDDFRVPDHIRVSDRVINDSELHRTKEMKPEDILTKSSNVGTIKIARGLGGDNLDAGIRNFGFGQKTGIEVWGESAGSVPDYQDWSGSSIGNIPIGQGITVTPLQLAAGYATLANGGRSVSPHLDKDTKPDASQERLISGDTSSIVRGMLQSVVEQGTGIHAQIPGYTVAGKTGTSQKIDPKTGAYSDHYIASFVGFVPVSDPEFVTLIAVDEPRKSIWGEQVAAPAFAKVTGFALKYYNVPPDRPRKATQ